MAFRRAAKARTKVANPARKRRKHRAAKTANPHRAKRRASRRKRNGYAAASHVTNPTRKRRRKAIRSTKRRNGYKRRNPEVGGMKLDGSTILTVALAGGSTALAMSFIQRSGALGRLQIQPKYQTAAAAAASATLGALGAYGFRNKPKVKKFFMAHAFISGGVAVFSALKSQTDALATSTMKEGSAIPGYAPEIDSTVKGLYLDRPNGMGLLQADMQGMYLPAPKGNTGMIQQDVGKSPARTFGK